MQSCTRYSPTDSDAERTGVYVSKTPRCPPPTAALADMSATTGMRRRFTRKNPDGSISSWDFYGGNLTGIAEKLPYLKSLGVTALYLNPIFKSPSNHKYDTSDYMHIDEAFGGDEALDMLISEAGKLGINVILDGVFSHTGADSIYFNKYGNFDSVGAYQCESSPYYRWYNFEEFPDKYDCWWGVGDLPNVNEDDKWYSRFIYGGENSVIRRYISCGVKGFRLDVADELPDDFIKGIRRAMTETDSDSLLLGEVWEDASNKFSHGEQREYLYGGELQSVMNYPFRDAAVEFIMGGSAKDFRRRLMSLYENYPPEQFYANLNLIGTHDTRRIITVLGEAPELESPEGKRDFRLSAGAYELAKGGLSCCLSYSLRYPEFRAYTTGTKPACRGMRTRSTAQVSHGAARIHSLSSISASYRICGMSTAYL